jgi:hypothetical protein
METREEREERWLKCENLIKEIRGTFITQYQAKNIYKLQIGGFRFSESRLDDNTSIVVIERQYDNEIFGEPYIFLIKGKIGEKLNMR